MKYIPLVGLVFSLCFCTSSNKSSAQPVSNQRTTDLPLDKIKLPKGFHIEVYAEGVTNARSMALSPEGTLYVGTRKEGSVYALRDEDNDMYAEKKYTLAQDMYMPNGVALRDGSLYVAEVNRILRYDNIETTLDKPTFEVVSEEFPSDAHHGWKFIAFGPDEKLYVPVGAPCNICEMEDPVYSTIMYMNPDGSDLKVYAHGVRNSVGFTWHPETKELWFTDNGRDHMGDDMPADELNYAPKPDMHFGFPYCHQGDTPDPEFGSKKPCADCTPPKAKLGAHVAALGMRFYTGDQFPEMYRNKAFIALHGSWNRSSKVGYTIVTATLTGNEVANVETFAEGWLQPGDDVWGRPVDITWMQDGSMLISDDFADVIYRVYYKG